MTLPPVVSVLEFCVTRRATWVDHNSQVVVDDAPHVWKRAKHGHAYYKVCRYCGGRKP